MITLSKRKKKNVGNQPFDVLNVGPLEATIWNNRRSTRCESDSGCRFTLARVVKHEGHLSVSKSFGPEDVVTFVGLLETLSRWFAFDAGTPKHLRAEMQVLTELLRATQGHAIKRKPSPNGVTNGS